MKKKNWYKGLTATAITLAMAGAALTVPAMAIDYDLNYGDVEIGTDENGNYTWSGQTQDGENYFHYKETDTEGVYEFESGKYWHTSNDTQINISQGIVDDFVDEEPNKDEGNINSETDITAPAEDTTTTDNVVNISGDTTEVDITIDNVNVDTDDSFLTIEDGSKTDVTINNSDITTGDDAIQIGENSDVDLTLDDTNVTVDLSQNEDFSASGIYIQDGSHVDLELSGVNTIKTENLAQKQQDALGHNVPANMYCGLNVEGIRVGGAVSDWRGDSSDSAASLTIKGEDNAQLNIDGFGTGMVISANASTTVQDGVTVNIDDSTATSSTQSGRGMIVAGSLEVTGEDTTLNVTGTTKGDYLIYNDTAGGHRDANSGWGIVSFGSGITVSDHASVNVSDVDSGGIYFGAGDFTVSDHANVTVHDSVGNGIWFEGNSHEFNISEYSNIYIHNANHGMNSSDGSTVYMNISDHSTVIADENRGSGIMNIHTTIEGNSYIEVSKNAYHGFTNGAFEIYDSKANFNDNGYIGLNIAALIPGHDSAVIKNSIVNVNNSGLNIDSNVSGAAIVLRHLPLIIEDSTVISYGSDVGVCFYNTSAGAGMITVKGSSVLAIDGQNYDFYDDWNKLGYTGRDFINSGSLQADLNSMYGHYIMNDPSLEGKTGLELFLAIAAKYNKGEGINAIVTGAPAGSVVAGKANDTQYTGPVNENGTLLFCFDLSGDKNKGAALTDNGDGTYTFRYTDPNNEEVVEYTFRYNTDEEDLEGEGNNAYVWTPVTIINYDPLNNDLSGSKIGTAHDNGNNTATDVTIFGTTINLAEKNMPSYDAKVDTDVTTTTDANGATVTTTTTTTSTYGWWVHVDEEGKLQVITPPDDNASQEEWDAFYALLNYQVTEETNLLELCGGDTKLAESITVYGMWTTTTEQHVETTPGEPEIPDYPEIPEYPELPDYDPPEVDIDDPDVPLVEEPEEPEQPTEEIDDEETPLTPSIPDEVIDDIIAEIEDEVTPLASVPQTGADEMPAATAALPAGVLALAVSAVVRRIRRKD